MGESDVIMRLRIALAQIPVNVEIRKNVQTLSRSIDFAINEKADILLTPEGSLSGYTHKFNQKEVQDALAYITERAAKGKLGLALGTCYEEDDGLIYNQIRFYDSDGNYLGFHSKILTCGTVNGTPEGEINYFAVSPLKTFNFKGIKIGGLICNDLWANPAWTPNPDIHLTQQLSKIGVRIIFHSVNGGRDSTEYAQVVQKNYHEANLRIRAAAGNLWIATVDNCFPQEIPTSSPGGIIDPKGNWIMKMSDEGEQLCAYTIEVD